MTDAQPNKDVREAVGVFREAKSFEAAIDDLLTSGFDRADLSLLAGERTVEEKLGHKYEKVSDLEDDSSAPRAGYISTESRGDAEGGLVGGLMYVGATAAAGAIVASGGTLATAIVAAVLAGSTGGVIGAFLAKWVGDHHARYLQQELDHGGLLLWVRTRDAEDEKRAVAILGKHSGSDVHVHALPSTPLPLKGGESYDLSFMNDFGL